MNTSQVTFALVPGSFSTPAEYDKVEALLQAQGHKTHTIELLSANDGTRQPPASTADDISHIKSELLKILDADKPSNVVLGLHSYAGIPGTSAVEGLSKSAREAQDKTNFVAGLLYIASFVPEVGDSVRKIMGAHNAMPEPFLTGFPGQYMPALPAQMAPMIFNDLIDETEVERYHSTMVMHSSDSYSGEVTYAGWKDVPSTLIIPSEDVIIPVKVQEWMGERVGEKMKVVREEGAGHCPNVSRPEVVVKELLALAHGN